MNHSIKWKAVIRDVAIIIIFQILATFVSLGKEIDNSGYAVPFILITGFTISGCRTTINRVKHLFFVALVLWLVEGLVFCLIALTDNDYGVLCTWLVSFIFILCYMLVGGGFAYLFVRGSAGSEMSTENTPIEKNNDTTKIDYDI